MNLLVQPNKWSCLTTSLAMLCDVSHDKIIEIIGHDGSEIIHPKMDEPYCRRSFAINELTKAALALGYALVEIEGTSLLSPTGLEVDAVPVTIPYWEDDMLLNYDALLLGEGRSGISHAAAWNHQRSLVYDPNGSRYQINFFRRESFYIIVRFGR
jgi:hypothetical protein